MLARATTFLTLALALAPAAAPAQAQYTVPPDNPFVGTPGARPEVYVSGMRNPYRWSFDRQTGDMYIGDVGGINEEITFLPRASSSGANLGWNCFSGTAVQSSCTPANYQPPAYEYPSSSDVVIGGYVVRDPALPSFAGRYLFGQFNGDLIFLGPGASGAEDDAGVNVSAVAGFGEDGAGHLYAVSLSGPVYRLVQPSPDVLATQSVGNFAQPVAVAAPPGDPDRLFVVEKAGRIQLRTGSTVTEFLDITALVGDDGGEEGLLAFAVAPDYGASGRVFAYYTDNNGDLQLDEFTRTAAGPDSSSAATRRPLLTIPHAAAANHNGGQLLFGPDGSLYLSTGDGGIQGDPEGDAQNLGSLLGKILRLDVGYTRVPDTTAPVLRTRVTPAPARAAAARRGGPRELQRAVLDRRRRPAEDRPALLPHAPCQPRRAVRRPHPDQGCAEPPRTAGAAARPAQPPPGRRASLAAGHRRRGQPFPPGQALGARAR